MSVSFADECLHLRRIGGRSQAGAEKKREKLFVPGLDLCGRSIMLKRAKHTGKDTLPKPLPRLSCPDQDAAVSSN
ncbi:hypothetical protein, partial [Desulfovibrio piger]|uniref:hypothetical protein n=1 Tax=Desulfovibrio piger TaxID=901 RepID=UPI0026ECD6F9